MLPKQILTNYKYENGHIGLCMFDFKIRKVWNGRFAAYYINQSRGDNYPRYLIAFIGNSEKVVTNKMEKWISKHLITFKYYEHRRN